MFTLTLIGKALPYSNNTLSSEADKLCYFEVACSYYYAQILIRSLSKVADKHCVAIHVCMSMYHTCFAEMISGSQ
jgi:hypothetical protein